MWWLIHSYWIFIALMFMVILLFVLRYSGTKRMTLEAAVELLKNGGPLIETGHESLPGIIVVSNDAITVHYSSARKTGDLCELVSYVPASSTGYLGGHHIGFSQGLVTYVQRVNCAARPQEDISYHEKVHCGKIMRLVKDAIDRSAKQK